MAAASVMLLKYFATSLMAHPGPVSCQRRARWKERAGLVNPSGSAQRKGDSRSVYYYSLFHSLKSGKMNNNFLTSKCNIE